MRIVMNLVPILFWGGIMCLTWGLGGGLIGIGIVCIIAAIHAVFA
jgi:hypothetical protein